MSLSLLDCLFTDESCELFDDESVAPSEAENRPHVLLADGDHDGHPRGPAMTDAEVASKGHQDATGESRKPDEAGLKALKSAWAVSDATKQLCPRQLQPQDPCNLPHSKQGGHRH